MALVCTHMEIFGFEVYHEYIIEYVEVVEHKCWTFEVHFYTFSVFQTVWGILYYALTLDLHHHLIKWLLIFQVKEDMTRFEAHSSEDILILLDTTPDQSMLDEGVAREVVNRIQKLRKKAGLAPTDEVTVHCHVQPAGHDLARVISEHRYLKQGFLRTELLTIMIPRFGKEKPATRLSFGAKCGRFFSFHGFQSVLKLISVLVTRSMMNLLTA